MKEIQVPRYIFCELLEMEALTSHTNCDFHLFSKILNTGRIQISIKTVVNFGDLDC